MLRPNTGKGTLGNGEQSLWVREDLPGLSTGSVEKQDVQHAIS